jgi:glycosyltransferase involved in cell wall biosynthesis
MNSTYMSNKTLTLTIVIPVYNEQSYIKACLDSIAKQIIKPLEVIVVDNNSTDKTVQIAERYSFVRIIHESRQHQVFAQAAGFNQAKGDILGRIDADSILRETWSENILEFFETCPETIAVTGSAEPYDMPMKRCGMAIFHGYIYVAGLIAGHRLIFGSNCAIRMNGWSKIRNQILMRPDIWEDYDLAFCLKKYGKIGYLAGNTVGVSFRAVHTTFVRHISYQFRSVRTFYLRTNIIRLFLFSLLWTTTILVYPLAAIDDWILKRRGTKPRPSYKA